MTTKMDITMEEWLKELGRLQDECPETEGWFTTEELQTKLGWSPDRVRKRIRQGIAQGLIQRGQRPLLTIDNKSVKVPCYRKVKNKGSK